MVVAPWLSVATAVSVCAFTGGLFQVTSYGLPFVASPIFTPLAKNSTLATLPSLSEAVAAMGMLDGARKNWPWVGLVMATSGETLWMMIGTPRSWELKLMSELF